MIVITALALAFFFWAPWWLIWTAWGVIALGVGWLYIVGRTT